jgi:site-specific DNA-methyltransferase (adenine-specific)
MGSGTTAVAAVKTKRNFIGYDTNEEYIKLSNKRILTAKQEMDTLL